MITESLMRLLDAEVPYARLLRRQLHAVPELGGHEYETAVLVKAALSVPSKSIAGTGLVVRLGPPSASGGAVGVRAELDALPIVERTGVPFSAIGDRMHACGHDVHLAALVALVRAAAEIQSELPAPLIAIFQPSEERSPSGALQVTADAQIIGESKAFVAVHVHPELPWGSLGLEAGVVNAQADEVQIRIDGVSGHAAYPHRARSVVPALLSLGQGMREIAGRLIDPMRPALVEVGVLRAGEAANVIPGTGELHATVRSMAYEDQRRLLAGIRQLADRISAAYDCAATVAVTKSDPPLVNDAALVDAARDLAADLAFDVAPPWGSCGGDDFAHYGQHRPALMAFVGLDGAPGFAPAALHTPGFLPPQEAVGQSARALLLAYLAAARLPPARPPVTTPV